MAFHTTTRNGHRFLGNTHKREVHDLRNEKSSCQVSELLAAGHGVYFIPDSHATAKAEGYDNCAYCLGGSTR